ncbi:hypothetical protein HGA13_08060 [Nocardia speluncae]|uniref:Uncharacterized protein n=1 Tax=Nocardia speluncae TaxID=419477 RepID=A0A846XC99_9NOCA|nr:hypothetical protein [Nocardia speluncae]NKY33025.1 hypothetical protein [Nocardia speluncae]
MPLRTSREESRSAGERGAPERTPVASVGTDNLDNLQYGMYVAADRDPVFPVAFGVGSLTTLMVSGWAWTEFGRDSVLATVALMIPMVIALGAVLLAARRRPPRLGIQLSPTEVMLGNWPERTFRFPRAAVTKVTMSNGPWTGSSTAAAPSHDFRRRMHHYIQITLRSNDIFCVAADPHNNPVNDRIVRELRRTAGPAALEPQAARPPKRPLEAPAAAPESPTGLASPSSGEKLWAAATRKHDEVLLAYLPYETEPLILMRYPALTDITQPATAGFHDAMEEANALRTETMPSDSKFAAAYRDSVRRLAVAWATAERTAKREGTTYLDPRDRRKLEQAAKLLRHAEGAASSPERAVYLRQAKSILVELVDNGAIHTPPKIVEAIDTATSLAIEAAEQR